MFLNQRLLSSAFFTPSAPPRPIHSNLLVREKEQCGSLDVRFFYLRRILRIWPLYYFVLALAILIPLFDPTHAFGLKYILPFFFLSGNWAFVAFGGLTSVAASPLWSVSVEEQFYLLWPPIVSRLSRRQIIYAAFGLIFVANFTRLVIVISSGSSMGLWANTFAHLDSIAAGILVSIILRGQAPVIRLPARIALIIFAVAGIALRGHFQLLVGDSPSWGTTLLGWPVVAVSCAVILVAFIGIKMQPPWLQYLGKISYGLYVYHMFCIMLIDYLLIQHRVPTHTLLHVVIRFIFSLSLTIFISAISYAILEKPFLRLKEKFTHVHSRPV